jgi:hypothetical protein
MHPRAPLTGLTYFRLVEDALSYAWTWQGNAPRGGGRDEK